MASICSSPTPQLPNLPVNQSPLSPREPRVGPKLGASRTCFPRHLSLSPPSRTTEPPSQTPRFPPRKHANVKCGTLPRTPLTKQAPAQRQGLQSSLCTTPANKFSSRSGGGDGQILWLTPGLDGHADGVAARLHHAKNGSGAAQAVFKYSSRPV